MDMLFLHKRLETEEVICEKCPYLEEHFCRMAGTELEMAGYIDKTLCRSNKWSKCSVFTSQFYYDSSDGY
jgi:hypothetical protein